MTPFALLLCLAQDSRLTKGERLDSLRRGLLAELADPANGTALLRWLGVALLAVCLLVPLVRWIRCAFLRHRFAKQLQRIGLERDEVQLFSSIVRRAPATLLLRRRLDPYAFDRVAHSVLRRMRVPAERDATMLRILALRHRLPFQDGQVFGSAEVGARIHVTLGAAEDAPSYRADVLAIQANALKVALLQREDGPPLVPGMIVRLKARLQGKTCETAALVRHRVDGVQPRVYVTRLAPFLRSRLALRIRSVSVQAKIELIERLPSRITENKAPVAEGLVTRDSIAGVYVAVKRARLNFGEAVRLDADTLSGEYVVFDEISSSLEQSHYFLIRVSTRYLDAVPPVAAKSKQVAAR